MHVLLIVQDSPYGSERPYQALRLAGALLEVEEELQVTLYLTADGVYCARRGQQTPQGYYSVERMLKPIVRRGAVLACRTCLEARGLAPDDLAEGVREARLGELAQLTLEADKVLVY